MFISDKDIGQTEGCKRIEAMMKRILYVYLWLAGGVFVILFFYRLLPGLEYLLGV